jgi:hypothetical protein
MTARGGWLGGASTVQVPIYVRTKASTAGRGDSAQIFEVVLARIVPSQSKDEKGTARGNERVTQPFGTDCAENR